MARRVRAVSTATRLGTVEPAEGAGEQLAQLRLARQPDRLAALDGIQRPFHGPFKPINLPNGGSCTSTVMSLSTNTSLSMSRSATMNRSPGAGDQRSPASRSLRASSTRITPQWPHARQRGSHGTLSRGTPPRLRVYCMRFPYSASSSHSAACDGHGIGS